MNPDKMSLCRLVYILSFFFMILVLNAISVDVSCAAEVSASIGFGYDTSNSTTESGTKTTEDYSQDYSLSYSENFNMVMDYSCDLGLSLSESKGDDQDTTSTIDPSVDMSLKSIAWDLGFGVKESISLSEDPAVERSTSLDYFLDITLSPQDIFPELQLSLSQTESFQRDASDNVNSSLDFSTSYEIDLLGGINFDFGYSKSVKNDRLQSDSDTMDQSYDFSTGISLDFTTNISYSIDYSFTASEGYTYFDDGTIKDESGSKSNDIGQGLDFKPFSGTSFGFTIDYSAGEDTISGDSDLSRSKSANVSQDIYDWISVTSDYSNQVSDTYSVNSSDTSTTSDSYSTGVTLSPNEFFDISIDSTQDKSVDNDNNVTQSRGLSFSWNTQLTEYLSLGYDLSNSKSYDDGDLTGNDDSIKFKLDVKGDTEINLNITPAYSYDKSRDLITGTETSSEAFSLAIDYEIALSSNMDLNLSHSYNRDHDITENVISRSDDSSLDFKFSQPIKDLEFSFSATRSTSDTSGDEEGPITNVSYSSSISWKVINITLDLSYSLDVPQDSFKSESYDASMSMTLLDNASLDLSYSFSQDLGDEVNNSDSISLSFSMDF